TRIIYPSWGSTRKTSRRPRERELDPVSANHQSFLGLIFCRARRYDEALAACRKAVELDPYYPVGQWFLALVHEQKRESPRISRNLRRQWPFRRAARSIGRCWPTPTLWSARKARH